MTYVSQDEISQTEILGHTVALTFLLAKKNGKHNIILKKKNFVCNNQFQCHSKN